MHGRGGEICDGGLRDSRVPAKERVISCLSPGQYADSPAASTFKIPARTFSKHDKRLKVAIQTQIIVNSTAMKSTNG